jgi:hypothetical protein
MAVGPNGDLYCGLSADGIIRVTGAGSSSSWSGAPTLSLALTSSGDGYSTGRALCHCIDRLETNGSYSTLHQDDLEWTYLGLAPDGTLYADIWAGTGKGLYQIDRTTGEPTPVVSGGPGAGGSGSLNALAFGSDQKLYTVGRVDFSPTGTKLLRLDGTQFTAVATMPNGGFDLAAGPPGIFYVLTNTDLGSGYLFGQVWIADLNKDTVTLLAQGAPEFHLTDPTFAAIAFDPNIQRLYVAGQGKIWAIWNTTPVRTESWGAVKALYR